MLSWLLGWWVRPTAKKPEEKKKIIVLPRGRHTLSPYRLLEWWGQPPALGTLDPLPPPPSPRK